MSKINRLISNGKKLKNPGADYTRWLYDLQHFFESRSMGDDVKMVDDALFFANDEIRFDQYTDRFLGLLQYMLEQSGGRNLSEEALRSVLIVDNGSADLASDMAAYLEKVGMKGIVASEAGSDLPLMYQIDECIDEISIAVIIYPENLEHGSQFDSVFETGYLAGKLGLESVYAVCDNCTCMTDIVKDMRCIDRHNWLLSLVDVLCDDGVILVDPKK